MNSIITNMFPECDKDMNLCFEKYLNNRIQYMKDHKLHQIRVGWFDESFDLVFKKVALEHEGKFGWNTRSMNNGTVKANYVYEMDLVYHH